MFRRLFSRPPAPAARRPARQPRLGLESLEAREVPTVAIRDIPNQDVPNDRPVYIPVTVTNSPNGPVGTTVVSSDPGRVQATVVSGGRTVQFNVSGGTGANAFTGTLTVRLFDSAAPLATQRIVDLVQSGYYNGKIFHRVADLFSSGTTPDTDARTSVIVQGGSPSGNGVGGSSLPDLVDEYNPDFTFASNGLVAFANAGDDNNNAQFFFTDIDRPLAERVEFLNFNHTIAGILTDGFDTLTRIKTTPLSGTTPVTPVTITSASVSDADPKGNAVVRLTPTEGFTGTSTVTVITTDNDGATSEAFTVTGVADTQNSRAFLGGVANQTTTAGTPVTFTLTGTDIDADTLTFAVRDQAFGSSPANATVSVDQATGRVTVTPAAGFTGALSLRAGVRDQTDRTGTGLESAGNYDTQAFSVTVSPATSPPPPPAGPPTATGSPQGSEPRVTVTNADGTQRFSVLAFEPTFTGGVRVATADVNADGTVDVIATPGPGGSPVVKIFNGTDGSLLSSQTVFEDSFRGGLFVDATGTQAVVGAGVGGGPRVSVINLTNGRVVQNFFAGNAASRGGVSVDIDTLSTTASRVFVVAGAGVGDAPAVAVFDATTGNVVGAFFAGDQTDRRGIRVRIGDPAAATPTARQVFVAPASTTGTDGETGFTPAAFMDLTATGRPQS